MTSSSSAVSATVVASEPTTAFWARCVTPKVGIRPYVGFRPGNPVKLAGVRIEPPPSLAVQNGTMPADTAADEPPLDPPGVRDGSHGFRVTPSSGLAVYAKVPNSGLAVFPTGIAPATRRRPTWMLSSGAGPRPAYQRDALVVGMPAQSSRSFTPKGTPASGPSSSTRPAATASSTRRASARARSGSTCTKALSSPSVRSIAARQASTSSVAPSSPARMAAAAAATVGISSCWRCSPMASSSPTGRPRCPGACQVRRWRHGGPVVRPR